MRGVFTFGSKDCGILVVTFEEKANQVQDGHLVDDLWKSLELKI